MSPQAIPGTNRYQLDLAISDEGHLAGCNVSNALRQVAERLAHHEDGGDLEWTMDPTDHRARVVGTWHLTALDADA